MEDKKENFFWLSMMVISLILFLILYYLLTFKFVHRYYLEGFLFLIPTVLISFMYFLRVKTSMNRSLLFSLLFILVFISTISSFFGFAFLIVDDLTTEVTEVGEYERIIGLEYYSKAIYQFPKQIPSDAKNVKFYYTPQFLQGAMSMQLKYQTNENEINYYKSLYENNSLAIFNAGDYSFSDLNSMGITDIGGNVKEEGDYLNDTIFVLDSKPYKEDNWNHGYVILIAINETNDTIVFESEVW